MWYSYLLRSSFIIEVNYGYNNVQSKQRAILLWKYESCAMTFLFQINSKRGTIILGRGIFILLS